MILRPTECSQLSDINKMELKDPDIQLRLAAFDRVQKLSQIHERLTAKELNPGYRSDILRYIILNKFGGLYADTDFECLKPIPSSILNYKFVAGLMFGNKPSIGNSILISSPNSLFLQKILKFCF